MEVNTKHVLAVFSLMVGLSFGVPYIVTEQENSSWLMLAIIFLGIAIFFWIWIMREQKSAEEAASDALDAAEENLKKLEAQAAEKTEDVTPTAEKDIPLARTPPATSAVGQTEAEVVEEALEDSPQTETVIEVEPEPEPVLETVDLDDDEQDEDDAPDTEAEPVVEIPDPEEALPEPEAESAPKLPEPDTDEEASSDDPDDLTRIEGIGPKYAELLGEAGITTFAQVADMDEDSIVATIKAQGGRKSASMGTWADQAKFAAEGDWDGLEAFQNDLSSGRR